MTKSSVYKIEFDFVHFGRTKGSENGMSLMNRLDSNGLIQNTTLVYPSCVLDFGQLLWDM